MNAKTKLATAGALILCWLTFAGSSCDDTNGPGKPPDAPELQDPGSMNTNGQFSVQWSSVNDATSYTLQEDDHSTFTSPNEYTGKATSRGFASKSNGTYFYRVNASNENGASVWSNVESIVVSITETISTPSTPQGPATGETDESLTFTTSGSTSNLGHAIEYRFLWGDGSSSAWSATPSASHVYSSAQNYSVRAQARCATHPSVVSAESTSKSLSISLSLHEVAAPTQLTGSSSGFPDSTYTFLTGGASCNQGHPVEYQFDWGDATLSTWTATTSRQYAWNQAGNYDVVSHARCSVDPSVMSAWLATAHQITISNPSCNLLILTPSTGANWPEGELRTISWQANTPATCGPVDLILYSQNDSLCPIAQAVPNSGVYDWLVTDCDIFPEVGFSYRVKIVSQNTSSEAFSQPFEITRSEVFTVTDAWWTNIVDTDNDGIRSAAQLNFSAQVNDGSWQVYAVLEYREHLTSSWFTYQSSDPFSVTATPPATQQDIAVGLPYPQLGPGLYDFRLTLLPVNQSAPALAVYEPAADDDLNAEAFEPRQLDQNYSIRDAWWDNIVDNDGDGYTSSRKLYVDVEVINGTFDVFVIIDARIYGTSSWTEYIRTDTFTVWDESTVDIKSVDIGSNHIDLGPALYDFRIRVFHEDHPDEAPVAIRAPEHDDDLGAEVFEPGGED